MERSQSLTHLGIPCEARVSSRPRRVRVGLRVDLSICRVSDALQRRQRTDAPT